jgi:hypothetical protein
VAKRYRRIALVGMGLGLLVAGDLLVPRRTDPRRFEPGVVASLESAMWRSYYDMDRPGLAVGMTRLLRSQFDFRPLRAVVVAFWAMIAAATFQRGRSLRAYRRALPALRRFFVAVERDSVVSFDAFEAADRELNWWIIHRDVARRGRPELERALAGASSIVYGVPEDALAEHAALRAEAMLLRDEWAARDSVTDDEWARITDLLRKSWGSLRAATYAGTVSERTMAPRVRRRARPRAARLASSRTPLRMSRSHGVRPV